MKAGRPIFSYSRAGKKGYSLPGLDVPGKAVKDLIPQSLLRTDKPPLPEVAEGEVVRHYVSLSALNHNIDYGFYPLGSCTMKYNPKINEDIARLPGFANLHPLQPEATVQGALKVLKAMEEYLCEISGMERFTFQPAAGAHGELTGLMLIKAYHENNGNPRKKVIIPDSAHGTNPATVAMCGYDVVEIKSDKEGGIDLPSLRAVLDEDVAGLMLTNPNTLGLYDKNIEKISRLIHDVGGLLYYDGANANAILGYSRPGDMGFDVVHFNLHKTFATPHGGGGPGSGPVGVKKELIPFLPVPLVGEKDGYYYHDYDYPLSIGRVRSFYGNFGVVLKAFAYIRTMGPDGLKRVSEDAVLNANYLMKKIAQNYELPYKRYCMHEFVLSAIRQKKDHGITARDIAKALLDFGIHPPTVYFPLVVEEALMIEPTETESKEILDTFIEAMEEINRRAAEEPKKLQGAPYNTPVRRLDETTAARRPILKWSPEIDDES